MKLFSRGIVTSVILGLAFLFSLTSCISYKNIPYFQDVPDTSKPVIAATVPFQNPKIQPDDVLNINIQTLDQSVTQILNFAGSSAVATGAGTTAIPQPITSGYLVDKNGEVELPFAGKVKLGGLTTQEARDTLTSIVGKQFVDPVVSVRFANFRVTVLGEVVRPSTYVVPNEKITIFDAIGLAGDMTIFGKRENVLLMRDSADNHKEMIRLNLNSKDIVGSPYFFLKPNDIVYVEPRVEKLASVDAVRTRNIAIISAGISLLVVIFSKVVK